MDLVKVISDFKNSLKYKNMLKSQNYFETFNDINFRQFKYSGLKGDVIDKYRANSKVSTNFFKIIVEQKVNYCVGNEISILNSNTTSNIDDDLDYLCENASIKSIGWLHIYVDEFGEFQYSIMKSEEIIPIYSKSIDKKLVSIIRFYKIDDIEVAEVWDENNVTRYSMVNGEYVQYELLTHLTTGGWGKIPFIPLYNNRYDMGDLESIKVLIDCYDTVFSDFCNNFEDFQQVLYKLVNYAKTLDDEQMACQLFEFIKKYGFVNVSEGGDFDILTREVPWQARKEFLQIVKQNIYLISQAVDPDALKGNSLTNVVIKASYSLLDLKANKFIKQIKKFLKSFMWFDNEFRRIAGEQTDNLDEIEYKFNKSIIMNESEIIEACVNSVGIISMETIISKHPWTDNLEDELKRIEKEDKENEDKENEMLNNNPEEDVNINNNAGGNPE